MEQKKIRYEWMDLARTLAIVSVVLCHAAESSCKQFNTYVLTEMTFSSRMFLFTCFTIGRTLGVPVFLMITGYLLLDREYSSRDYAVFLKKRCLHLLICTWVWYAIYDVFFVFYMHVPLTPVQIAGDFLFIRPFTAGHAWYMPMILGMYLLLPLVANALHTIDTKLLTIPVIIYAAYAFGYPTLNMLAQFLFGKGLELRFNLGFSGGGYGIFIFLGYAIKKGAFRRIKIPLLAILAILSIVAAGYVQCLAFTKGHAYKLRYDFPTVLIGSLAYTELLSRISHVRFANVFRFLACHAFGVYLSHLLFVRLFENYIIDRDISWPLKIGGVWLVSITLAYLLVWAIGRIPKVGKYILYEK